MKSSSQYSPSSRHTDNNTQPSIRGRCSTNGLTELASADRLPQHPVCQSQQKYRFMQAPLVRELIIISRCSKSCTLQQITAFLRQQRCKTQRNKSLHSYRAYVCSIKLTTEKQFNKSFGLYVFQPTCCLQANRNVSVFKKKMRQKSEDCLALSKGGSKRMVLLLLCTRLRSNLRPTVRHRKTK